MARKFPPFAAVRAFEAAARHGSFKLSAQELCLSPSAISHQIRALEAYLGTALFERAGNRLELTLTGRGYSGKLTELLDAFDESARAARASEQIPFRVLCTPGFAARWLVPRLSRLRFGDRVRLRISHGAPSVDFANNDADVVIQWAAERTPGVRTEPLMESIRYPVISPDLRARQDIRAPADLLRVTLMHDEVMDDWDNWFRAAGLTPPEMPRGPVFPNCELATTAAEQGLGVSLAYDAVVRGTIAQKRLVRLFDTVTMPKTIYSVAYPEARAGNPEIRTFRDWLFGEVAAEESALRPA